MSTRLLVRLPNWLGDAVLATPALRALRRAHPEAELVVEGRPGLASLAHALVGVDGFLPDPRGGSQRARARRLRGFDTALLLPQSVSSAVGPFLARVPVRAGFARDPLRWALLTQRVVPPRTRRRHPSVSMVAHYLRLVRALGLPDAGPELELAVPEAAREAVARRLAGVEAFALLVPGAGFGPSKRWPPEHFAAAALALGREHGLGTVLAPGPGEEPLAHSVAEAAGPGALVLDAPPLDLAELVALVARARLVLTGDTGPRAIAAALGVPAVVLVGPTDPMHGGEDRAGERVLREDVECSPCYRPVCPIDHRCLVRLAPERAVAAARALLP